ncbi:MAG: ribose 5-phosphate isomerase B [archaeon]
MKVYLGSDHAGYKLKEYVQKHLLQKKGFETVDLGTHSEDSVDYPDFAEKVAEKVMQGKNAFGILMCGTGIGMSISANKIKGIRAAVVYDRYTARVAREHNNANIICLGGKTTKTPEAAKILDAFFSAKKPLKGSRHARRVKKIGALEKNC